MYVCMHIRRSNVPHAHNGCMNVTLYVFTYVSTSVFTSVSARIPMSCRPVCVYVWGGGEGGRGGGGGRRVVPSICTSQHDKSPC
jgi:hypothetical protein